MWSRSFYLIAATLFTFACAGTTSTSEFSVENSAVVENEILSTSDLFELTRGGIARLEVSTCDGGGLGTGFMISEKQIVTVAHVVDGAEEILAIIDGEVAVAKILAIDVERDLALLETDIPFGSYYFSLGDFEYRTGDEVSVIGFPRGLDITLTKGTISNDNVKIPEFPLLTFVQIDAAANPGNSGGPVLNSQGEVIGILDMGLRESEGLNFAISVNTVDRIFNSWKDNQPISMSNCGYNFEPETANPAPASGNSQQAPATTVIPTPMPAPTASGITAPDQPLTAEGYDHCSDCDDVKYNLVGAEFAGYEARVTDLDGFVSLEVWVVADNYREPCEVRWWKQPWSKNTWNTGLNSPPAGETTLEVAAICVPMVPGPLSFEVIFTDGNGNITNDPPWPGMKSPIGPLNPCTVDYASNGWCLQGS